MGTAIKHPVPDRVNLSFVIFDIRCRAKSGALRYLAHFDAVNKQLTISLDSDVLHALTVSSRSLIAYSNAIQ